MVSNPAGEWVGGTARVEASGAAAEAMARGVAEAERAAEERRREWAARFEAAEGGLRISGLDASKEARLHGETTWVVDSEAAEANGRAHYVSDTGACLSWQGVGCGCCLCGRAVCAVVRAWRGWG